MDLRSPVKILLVAITLGPAPLPLFQRRTWSSSSPRMSDDCPCPHGLSNAAGLAARAPLAPLWHYAMFLAIWSDIKQKENQDILAFFCIFFYLIFSYFGWEVLNENRTDWIPKLDYHFSCTEILHGNFILINDIRSFQFDLEFKIWF